MAKICVDTAESEPSRIWPASLPVPLGKLKTYVGLCLVRVASVTARLFARLLGRLVARLLAGLLARLVARLLARFLGILFVAARRVARLAITSVIRVPRTPCFGYALCLRSLIQGRRSLRGWGAHFHFAACLPAYCLQNHWSYAI